MFAFQSSPKLIQGVADRLVVETDQTLASENHDVEAWEIVLSAEGFPDLPFDPVSLDCKLQIFLGKNQSDPGVTEFVRCRQDQKIPMRNLQLYVIEDFAVISRS